MERSNSNIYIVLLISIPISLIIGFLAGYLTTYPKQAELQNKIDAAVAKAKIPLISQNTELSNNIQILNKKVKNQSQYLQSLQKQNEKLSTQKINVQKQALATKKTNSNYDSSTAGTVSRNIEITLLKGYEELNYAKLDFKLTNNSSNYLRLCAVVIAVYDVNSNYLGKSSLPVYNFSPRGQMFETASFRDVDINKIDNYKIVLSTVVDSNFRNLTSKFELVLINNFSPDKLTKKIKKYQKNL